MRFFAVAAAFAACFAASALPAQDFVGFDRASFGSVVLKRNQTAGAGDVSLELSVGSYNNESITNYSDDSIFARIGLSVGRLDILTDNGVFPCTAFIVSSRHVLTNYHCVPGILDNERARATRIDAVQFVAGYTQTGVEEGTQKFVVLPNPVEAHQDLDYALLEVIGNPSADYGMLELSDRTPRDGDPYWVIGHPMGEAQRISREQCRANRPAVSGARLLHTCDTLPGNSGSPVIDASLQKVVGLHHAGSKKDSVNFAIPMHAIIARSEVLEAALRAPGGGTVRPPVTDASPPPVDPGPVVTPDAPEANICDTLYAEAKNFGRCFAYEAYIQRCDAHTFAPFAAAFIADQCSAPETPVEKPPAPMAKAPLRPWCANGGLNATERAICGSEWLAGLDADLERAYRTQSGKATAAQQRAWIANTRNACGSNETCIGRETSSRVAYLTAPVAAPPPSGGADYRLVRGNYQLPSGQCYIVTASRASVAEARAFVRQWFAGRNGVRIFQSQNGFFGITVETIATSRSDWRLNQLKSQGAIPGDSFCSSGRLYVAEVVRAAGGGDAGGGRVMYADNNADGGLNVRSGPGTQFNDFTEIAPGTALTVRRSSGNWSNVTLPNGREGWVYTPLLTATKPYVQQCSARVVRLDPRNWGGSNSYLNMRDKPSTAARKVSEVYLDDSVRVLAQRDGWARIACVSGGCTNPNNGQARATGWSSAKFLSIRCN
ncbi:trypsin-like peptidase domain-containing protein [Cognatishimia sp. F0-27]|uniref:trypsin-like peptidase domain-containing protein n=1 Tax=Cognatishimia sp. F0-27 TaxID=2816855 RepID=UPI001D0C8F2A|nr:trypsin-like peptidase domain-containing protein [Cognatishimia sp. F0-27]MCC1492221.1 SH3 domain-containing protein [Cognatishimia sp. F0-27]